MSQSLDILNIFNARTSEMSFLKTKIFFEKLEYRFLVDSTIIERATFLYKTALSNGNVRTNEMGRRKWTYHKKTQFCLKQLYFLENLL